MEVWVHGVWSGVCVLRGQLGAEVDWEAWVMEAGLVLGWVENVDLQ